MFLTRVERSDPNSIISVDKLFDNVFLPMSVCVTVVDQLICTKQEMLGLVLDSLQQLTLHSAYNSVIDFWSRVVRSKSGPGTYSVVQPVNVLVRFPGVEFDVPCLCFLLDEKDVLTTNTSDASKIAWHAGHMTLSVEHDAWELSEDLSELCDPPMPCRVVVRVSGLQFREVACIQRLRQFYENDGRLSFFNGKLHTQDDIDGFVRQIKHNADYFHCNFAPDAARRVWFDLVYARSGPNLFGMRLPHLIRLVTPEYDISGIPQGSVAIYDRVVIEKLSFPLDRDPDKCVGLYSCNINMVITHGKSNMLPSTKELWPDIKSSLHELPPPGCSVLIYLSSVTFVSVVSEHEINTMWYGASGKPQNTTVAKKVRAWWAGVNAYMQQVLNAPD